MEISDQDQNREMGIVAWVGVGGIQSVKGVGTLSHRMPPSTPSVVGDNGVKKLAALCEPGPVL